MKNKILSTALKVALYAVFLAGTAGATVGAQVLGNDDPVATGVLMGLLTVILVKVWK